MREEEGKGELGKDEQDILFPRYLALQALEEPKTARKKDRLQEGGERRHPREGGCRGEKMGSGGKERVEPAGERGIEKR